MSSKLNQERKIEYYPKNEFYSLDRVFGLGTKNNYSISINNLNGILAWVTGPYVVFYDMEVDEQIGYLKNINNKIISCIKFGKNGKLFATGEGNCRNGSICIYEFNYNNNTKEESHKLIFEKRAHKSGIDKLLFMRDDNYILSIGNDEDKIINILDIKNNQHIFSSTFNRPILSSEVCDEFIILCGTGFIKIYNYQKLLTSTPEELESKHLMKKTLVDLSKLKDCSFISVVIYENSLDKNLSKIFFMTFDCHLVEMKKNETKFSRWVHLKAKYGITLNLWKNLIGCGLSDGIYRVFNADNLTHVLTLQRPPPLGKLNYKFNSESNISNSNIDIFPDVIASAYDIYHQKLVVIYSNKTFFIWDISKPNKVEIYRNNIFHSGGIKAMDYNISKEENLIKIATCSDDNTVIYWNIKLDDFLPNPLSNQKNQHIFYSKYIRHIFYFCNKYNHFKIDLNDVLHIQLKINNNIDEEFYLTSLRFSPDAKYLTIGDCIGNLLIYDLNTFEQIISIPAHRGDINSIDMITNYDNNESFLSTGGSDNFISVFNISNGFSKDMNNFNILEKMKSAVLSVVFCIDKLNNLKLVTAEQNSTISFFLLQNFELQIVQQYHPENVKTYCLNYSKTLQKILSGHNGKISLWKTSSNIPQKHFQVNKGDKPLDNFRIASDSTGVIFATSNNDKIIRIRAFHDGKLLCKIPVSESISSLFFILEDNYLIATSIEGYIYFYKLNQELIKNMQKNNDLINSVESQKIIDNKFKFLEKLMENETSLSKNEKMIYLFNKFKQSEEITPDDLKHLNNFYKENKKIHQEIFNTEIKSKKSREIILSEEKPNNNDDQENENNEELNKGKDDNIILNRSKKFEKGMLNFLVRSNNKDGRTSLTDTYFKKKVFPKIKIIDTKKEDENINITEKNKINKDEIDNEEKKENNEENTLPFKPEKENYDNDKSIKIINEKSIKDKNDIMEMNEIIKNVTNEINKVDLQIQNENSNKNIFNNNNKEDSLINTENILYQNNKKEENIIEDNKKDIKEEINLDDVKIEHKEESQISNKNSESNININEEIEKKNLENNQENINSMQSSFRVKSIHNSETSNSNVSQKNLNLTQTSSNFNFIPPTKSNFDIIISCQEEQIILESIERNKKEEMIISKVNDIQIINNKINNKDKIMKYINEIDINNLEGKDELKNLEKKLEILLKNIRIKLGCKDDNAELENILEKYSMMLLDKIEKNLNKNK